MDTWSGRWDYFLYGDEHFTYGCDSKDITRSGYYFDNWGAGFGVIQDQIPVVYEPEYKYTITGPGRVTIIIAGREDQNGHGSVNLQGIGTIYLNVTSKENGEWMHNARGWWYQNADGTYPINQWKYISKNWYYMSVNGQMLTGWQIIGDDWYYFDGSETMAVDAWIDGYYVNSNGAWVH